MTLDCVEISLARVFESGQAYVALSRARSLEGLRVMDFDPRVVQANSDVLMFYKKLKRDRLLLQVSATSLCHSVNPSLWWPHFTVPDWRIAPIMGGGWGGGWMWHHKNVLQERGKLKANRARWIVCGRRLDSVFRTTHYPSRRNLFSSTSSSLTSKCPFFWIKRFDYIR